MGTAITAIGTAILGAGASTAAAATVGGLVTAGAALGAATLGESLFGSSVQQPGTIQTPIDKTTMDAREALDSPLVGTEKDAKRKKAAAKSQFKVDLSPAETGITSPEPTKVTGVQL